MPMDSTSRARAAKQIRAKIEGPVLLVCIASVGIVLGAGAISPGVLSAGYLLQQLQIASIVGSLATGAMLVILLGHIDLSVPLTITATAILSTSLAGSGNAFLEAIAIPAGLAAGLLIGTINGLGVVVFRIPAMVWTLAVNAMLLGLTVFYTGGFKPHGAPPPLAVFIAHGRFLDIPNSFLLWVAIGGITLFLLRKTVFGTYIYAYGQSQRALFMAGAPVEAMTICVFAFAGLMSSIGALMLVGYANQAYQGMGDSYLLPVIAAVVIGGTSILGGKGTFAGTFFGAIFITLLSSVLSLMQIQDAIRQIIFGAIILAMLLINRNRQEA